MANVPSLEQMLKAGMHFGHRTSKWHPKMAPYIFTSRKGVHIIDLVKSREKLHSALEHISKLISDGKIILFVGTKPQVKMIMQNMAEENGQPYVVGKWMGGFLTNFPVIRKLIKKYIDLNTQKDGGKLNKYTKKERADFDKEIEKLKFKVGGLTSLNKLPDVMFVWDIKQEKTAVTEAKKRKIPIIAICDTNVNPDGIDYIIPANDDASKTVKLVISSISEAIKEGKAKQGK